MGLFIHCWYWWSQLALRVHIEKGETVRMMRLKIERQRSHKLRCCIYHQHSNMFDIEVSELVISWLNKYNFSFFTENNDFFFQFRMRKWMKTSLLCVCVFVPSKIDKVVLQHLFMRSLLRDSNFSMQKIHSTKNEIL